MKFWGMTGIPPRRPDGTLCATATAETAHAYVHVLTGRLLAIAQSRTPPRRTRASPPSPTGHSRPEGVMPAIAYATPAHCRWLPDVRFARDGTVPQRGVIGAGGGWSSQPPPEEDLM